MSEKTEKASPYKLQKAKEKGQVSKSNELTSSVSCLLMLALMSVLWPKQLATLEALLSQLLMLASHMNFTPDKITQLHHQILGTLLSLWFPFAFVAVLSLILSTSAQTGLVWSMTSITPDFKRLNVVQGFKKLCSMNNAFDALKSLLKLSSSLGLLYFLFKNQIPNLIQDSLSQSTPNPQLMMHFILKIMLQLVCLLFVFAFLDKGYTRWKFAKDQRMSKHEVKEEYKQREGDPKIKSKIKQLQMKFRQKTAALNQVKTADVVITNPTHIAIALQYTRHSMPAPKVVYKAQDKMVPQVKALAKKHHIPIIEHKVLARMLHHSAELNQYIGKELFPLTAQIFKALYQQREAV